MKRTQQKQRGSTVIGVILGVLIGLGVALGVAVYVMKVPTPFNSKSTSRTPAQDAAENKKNKDWDPNAALSNKPVAKPVEADAKTPAAPQAMPDKAVKPSTTASPLATSPATPTPTGDSAVEFYVQVGAFRSDADAQALRAKLALSNFDAKVIEREQAGQKVFRVRVGPFANQAAGDKAKASLDAAGFDTMVMRAQR
jgi:cell division protein FtsN